jgi:hypothetical protein
MGAEIRGSLAWNGETDRQGKWIVETERVLVGIY